MSKRAKDQFKFGGILYLLGLVLIYYACMVCSYVMLGEHLEREAKGFAAFLGGLLILERLFAVFLRIQILSKQELKPHVKLAQVFTSLIYLDQLLCLVQQTERVWGKYLERGQQLTFLEENLDLDLKGDSPSVLLDAPSRPYHLVLLHQLYAGVALHYPSFIAAAHYLVNQIDPLLGEEDTLSQAPKITLFFLLCSTALTVQVYFLYVSHLPQDQ